MKHSGNRSSLWQWRRPANWRWGALLVALLLGVVPLGYGSLASASVKAGGVGAPALGRYSFAASGAWRVVRSPQGATGGLSTITCPTSRVCFAVGAGGVILASTDGGASWRVQRSPVEKGPGPVYPCPKDWVPPPNVHRPYVCRILIDPALDAIDCPTSTACLAVGEGGNIVATLDGGATWQSRPSRTYNALRGIACPTRADCLAVGANGPDVGFANGDEFEDTQPPTILASTNGGAGWARRSSGTGTHTALNGIACPTRTDCLAVGSQEGVGAILASTDGGATWHRRALVPKASWLSGIACPTRTDCLAVGWGPMTAARSWPARTAA